MTSLKQSGKREDRLGVETGSMTIEAALGLFAFILISFIWISFLQLLRIQSMVSHALDQVTLEVASQITFADALGNQVEEVELVLGSAVFQQTTKDKGDNWIGLEKTMSAFTSVLNPSKAYLTKLLFNYLEGEETNFGILYDQGTLSGLDWVLDVDTDKQMLNLELSYQLDLPLPVSNWSSLSIAQESATGLWRLPEAELVLTDDKNKESNEEEGEASSIWDESSFARGRHFALKHRTKASGQAIKAGKGFDVYYEPNTLEEVFSLQIFAKTYASGQGTDPKDYTLKRQGLEKAINNRIQKMKDNFHKHDQVELEGGQLIDLSPGMTLKLHMIVPEDAKLFQAELDQIIRQLAEENGIDIEISYQEKKFVEDPDEKD